MASIDLGKLGKMKVNQLQAIFAEVVGEATRCPNRTYLIRRIKEAIAADGRATTRTTELASNVRASDLTETAPIIAPLAAAHPLQVAGVEAPAPESTRLDVAALRALYLEVIGRPTTSTNRDYLIWKIREAQKGRVPLGPKKCPQPASTSVQVLPLRFPSDLVDQIDDAWRRLGLRNRTELFRKSLQTYLARSGEADLAALIAGDA